MKHTLIQKLSMLSFFLLMASTTTTIAQEEDTRFLDRVRFGGGIGFNAGTNFLAFNISPTAVYQFNEYLSAGPSLIYSYQSSNSFKTSLYGGSVIVLANPFRELQLSAEIEQLRVNQTIERVGLADFENNTWNTAFFVGGGYNTGNVIVGVRYNLLFNDEDAIYTQAWAPFVRVFF